MIDYRCYRHDPRGHVIAVHAFAAPSDAIAADIVRTAEWSREWTSFSLWCGTRRIVQSENLEPGSRGEAA